MGIDLFRFRLYGLSVETTTYPLPQIGGGPRALVTCIGLTCFRAYVEWDRSGRPISHRRST